MPAQTDTSSGTNLTSICAEQGDKQVWEPGCAAAISPGSVGRQDFGTSPAMGGTRGVPGAGLPSQGAPSAPGPCRAQPELLLPFAAPPLPAL